MEKETSSKKRRARTALFYSLFGIYVAVFLAFSIRQLTLLNGWLRQDEAPPSEPQTDQAPIDPPEVQNDRIFAQLFEDPDWAALYDLAGIQDTPYEGRDAYAAYMGETVGGSGLTYTQVATERPNARRYIVRLGDQKIAAYTLSEDQAQWALDDLELFFTRDHALTVQKLPEQTVYINGVALDERHVISRTETAAQDYLPEGVNGFRLEQQRLEGLLMPPAVEIRDGGGNTVPFAADENGMLYVQLPPAGEISQEEIDIAIAAAKANAQFSIRAIGADRLAQNFDRESQIYQDLCATPSFVQKYTHYGFDDKVTAVRDYYRYNDEMFSARVVLDMKITRTNGYVKTFHADNTYFFTKNSKGKYLVTAMTNVDVQAPQTQVRLDFILDSGTVTQFIDPNAGELALPEIPAGEGQVLSGWATRAKDAEGNWVMTVVFRTDEGSTVVRDPNKPLVPMTLYPVFEPTP